MNEHTQIIFHEMILLLVKLGKKKKNRLFRQMKPSLKITNTTLHETNLSTDEELNDRKHPDIFLTMTLRKYYRQVLTTSVRWFN